MISTIYPVILTVPPAARELPPRERTALLSRHAREALRISAERVRIELGSLEKDARGAPLPFEGRFWSVTHKPDYVGGVVARSAVGLDLERIRPCSPALFRKTAGEAEWGLGAGGDRQRLFFRYWTAKEAVLKTGGEGLKDLSRCRVRQVIDDRHLLVDYAGQTWAVEQFFFDGHVASVGGRGLQVEWTLLT